MRHVSEVVIRTSNIPNLTCRSRARYKSEFALAGTHSDLDNHFRWLSQVRVGYLFTSFDIEYCIYHTCNSRKKNHQVYCVGVIMLPIIFIASSTKSIPPLTLDFGWLHYRASLIPMALHICILLLQWQILNFTPEYSLGSCCILPLSCPCSPQLMDLAQMLQQLGIQLLRGVFMRWFLRICYERAIIEYTKDHPMFGLSLACFKRSRAGPLGRFGEGVRTEGLFVLEVTVAGVAAWPEGDEEDIKHCCRRKRHAVAMWVVVEPCQCECGFNKST